MRIKIRNLLVVAAMASTVPSGWYLTGLGTVTSTGTVPVVGEACVAGPTGNGQDGTWSSVELTATTTGGVYAVWNNTSVLLTSTPAAVV
jgi:hypothetical protein